MTTALELIGIHKSFDGFAALTGAHFLAQWGEVHALLGENGAGKSSLMNIAAGIYAPEAGAVIVDDNPVQFSGPRDAARQRIGMVHQHFKLVRAFTVAQNILLNLPADREPLSHGRRLRRIETDREAERLLRTVQALARGGAAVVLVTHKMAEVKTYADRVTVMRGGRTVATLDPRQTAVGELVRLTVGESVTQASRAPCAPGEVRLAVRKLGSPSTVQGRRVLDGIDLELRAREIYGLAGVGGNGQSEFANAIMGLPEVTEGEIHLQGFGDLKAAPAQARRALGLAAIPSDRYGLALAGALSVAENFGIGQVHTGRYGSVWRLHRRRLDADAEAAVAAFDVLGVHRVSQKAALLSGGNAQKLVIAREFSAVPKLVLAHSPSRGLDVRAATEVHARLLDARDGGAAVLLITEDLDEVLALADRVGVMTRGRIVAEFAQPADRQAIGQAMVDHG